MKPRTNAISPEIPYYQPRQIPLDTFTAKVERIFAARRFSNFGEQEQELAHKIASAHDVKECVLVANATLGLQLLMLALDLNGEVITPSFTFIATTHAITLNGLNPKFCDIDPATLTLDPSKVESLITKETSAILAVHVFGQTCHIEELTRIANAHGIKLIFDSAHCFGVRRRGTSIGNFGNAEVLSFHATKLFHTFEGGAILTNDADLAKKLRVMSNFGITGQDQVGYLGSNSKMHEVSAAFGLTFLPFIPETIAKLRQIHSEYQKLLSCQTGIRVISTTPDVESNCQYFPILVDESHFGASRDELYTHLQQMGIGSRRYFYPGTHKQAPYSGWESTQYARLNVTDEVTSQVLCLPCYYDLSLESLKIICGVILDFGEQRRNLLKSA